MMEGGWRGDENLPSVVGGAVGGATAAVVGGCCCGLGLCGGVGGEAEDGGEGVAHFDGCDGCKLLKV